MEVKIRETCQACDGTGKNHISYEIARKVVDKTSGMRFKTDENRITAIQKCRECDGGYIESWVSVNELLSLGI